MRRSKLEVHENAFFTSAAKMHRETTGRATVPSTQIRARTLRTLSVCKLIKPFICTVIILKCNYHEKRFPFVFFIDLFCPVACFCSLLTLPSVVFSICSVGKPILNSRQGPRYTTLKTSRNDSKGKVLQPL